MADREDILRWLSARRWRCVPPSVQRIVERLVLEGKAEWLPSPRTVTYSNGRKVRMPCARAKALDGSG